MSYLSDLVRAATGKSVGENIGRAVGTAVGGPVGGKIGEKIGGSTTRALDTDRSNTGQSVAVDTAPEPPRESAGSGEMGLRMEQMPYGMPGIQPAVYRGSAPSLPGTEQRYFDERIQPALNLPAIVGGGAIAVAPFIIDALTGEKKKLRVTRKLKSQVKQAVEMFGVKEVAKQMKTDVDVIFYILTKRMRNDGPYVTKAAVRKTRQTVRKMKHLCDMYEDLRPAARRRAPARKASTTRITNVK